VARSEGVEVDHLTTIVLNSIGNYDGTNVGKVLADARNVHDLQNWTLDVSSEMTIDDYLYRLKVARVSLSRSVEETMLAVVGNTPLEAG
jgi:predicted solute-binding protein